MGKQTQNNVTNGYNDLTNILFMWKSHGYPNKEVRTYRHIIRQYEIKELLIIIFNIPIRIILIRS